MFLVSTDDTMSSPLDRHIGESSPSARISERGSPLSEHRDSPLSERLDTLSGERRSLVRTENRLKGQHSASVVVGSVRIKAEFDDFSYGDTCSVSPKVLAERKKYRSDGTPELIGSRIKEEPLEKAVPCGEAGQTEAGFHAPVASSAHQLAHLAGHENIGNFGLWSHKKFGIGSFVQYGACGTRSGLQNDVPRSFYPRDSQNSLRGGTSVDGSPDSGNSSESRKSFMYGSPNITVKSEKSPSPKCDPATAKSTPVQSPHTPDQFLTHSWVHVTRSKSCSPESQSPAEVASLMYNRGETSHGLDSRQNQDFDLTSVYPCKFCSEAFSLYTALQEHIRLEHSDTSVANSKSTESGKAHLRVGSHQDARFNTAYSEGTDGKYTCKFCSLAFEFYTVLQEHIRIAHDGGRRGSVNSNASAKIQSCVSPVAVDGPSKYPCKHCEESFPLYTALQEHIRIEHGENAYWGRAAYMSMMVDGREEYFEEIMNCSDCQFCPEKFASPLLLQEHVKIKHVPKWVAQRKAMAQPTLPAVSTGNDPVLPVQNSPAEEAKNQDIVKNVLKKYVCSVCSKEYTNKLHYQVHVKSHSKDLVEEKVEPKLELPPKPPEPLVPVPQFPTNQDTKSVNVEDLRYVCEVCNARFPLYVVMQEHIRTAHGEKPFKCDLCEKEFIKRNYLMKHMKAHAEAKAQVLKCHKCDRCFIDQTRLQEHAKEHMNEGRYKCHVCGSCFTHKMHHDQHVRTHSGEKPYKCGECNKEFSQPGPFHNHVRSHARCAYCSRTFLEKAALFLHLKTEHGQKVSEEVNRSSPVSVGSVSGNPTSVVASPLMPVPVRLPETDYIVPSPNEPLNLSKNSKESPLRVTPVTIPSGSHLMSPLMFPGVELYADLMSSLSAGATMSVASSNSNNSLNDSSRPNSAKSDTTSEIRLSKSELLEQGKSPSYGRDSDVIKAMKDGSKLPNRYLEKSLDSSRNHADVNGSDKGHQGPLSVDFLSTSSGVSSQHCKSTESHLAYLSKSSVGFTNANSSLKCEKLESNKSRETVDKHWCASPRLENVSPKTLPPECLMYSAMMHSEMFQKSPSLVFENFGRHSAFLDGKRPLPSDTSSSSPPSLMIRKTDKVDNILIGLEPSVRDNRTPNGDKYSNGSRDKRNENKTVATGFELFNERSPHSDIHLDDCVAYVCDICTEVFLTKTAGDGHVCKTFGDSKTPGRGVEKTEAENSSNGNYGSSRWTILPKTEVFHCKSCSKIFWGKSELQEHLETHREFTNLDDSSTKRGQHFSCDLCDDSFTSSDLLFRHLRLHSGIRQHECRICNRVFLLRRHLEAHCAEDHSHPCPDCGLSRHETISQHNDNHCACNSTGRRHDPGPPLMQLLEVHKTDRKRGVEVPNELEQNHDERPLKRRKAEMERPFQCAKCHERFVGVAKLVDHVENNLCRSFTCSVCQKEFLKKSQLKCHLKTHQRLGEGLKRDGRVPEGGIRDQSGDAPGIDDYENSEIKSFTENCDTCDNQELKNATSMTTNRLTVMLTDGAESADDGRRESTSSS